MLCVCYRWQLVWISMFIPKNNVISTHDLFQLKQSLSQYMSQYAKSVYPVGYKTIKCFDMHILIAYWKKVENKFEK